MTAAAPTRAPSPPSPARGAASAPVHGGLLAGLRARPGPHLALWAVPALLIAALPLLVTRLTPPPPPSTGLPGIGETVLSVLILAAQLFPQLFVLILFAGPAGVLVAGGSLDRALGALRTPALAAVAAALSLWLTAALLFTVLPGLLALQASPLMSLIFIAVGVIGGAAASVAVFGRWMYAPALVAAHGLGATEALDTSHAHAQAQRNFGPALGFAAVFALIAFLASALGAILHGLVVPAPMPAPGTEGMGAPAGGLASSGVRGLAAAVGGSWLVLWPGLAMLTSAVAVRLEGFLAGGALPSAAPTLALRSRPSLCPVCGALAPVAVAGASAKVACPRCGLTATLR